MSFNWSMLGEKWVNIRNKYLGGSMLGGSVEVSLVSEDARYKREFENSIGPRIYHSHLSDYFICCAFCTHLKRSSCHEYCFTCSRETCGECSLLLPGTYEYACDRLDLSGDEITPWIFKTPCTGFERLDSRKYFRHFSLSGQSITLTNYEALEGIFFGICRGKRPCHICASVNIDIYNNCSSEERTVLDSPCSRILNEISVKYRAIFGMIRYTD